MLKKLGLFIVAIFFLFTSIGFASAFIFNGTTADIYGNALNNSNITIIIRDDTWTQVGVNETSSDANGFFSVSLAENTSYMYQATIYHVNSSTGTVDYVGSSMPAFPYFEFSTINNVNFFLKDGGTINITAINSSGQRTTFTYQVKDTKLGYSIAENWQTYSTEEIVYVQKDRNYSIMIFPNESMPVSFDWNNFSSNTSYSIGDISNYNATTNTLHKPFNTTQTFVRVSGYVNTSAGTNGWEELTVIPFLLEPGNMVYLGQGGLPYNMSAWNGQSDIYDLTTGFYNITIIGSAEAVSYILFAAAKNNSNFYGGFTNVSLNYSSSAMSYNFEMYGLLGNADNITANDAATWTPTNISTARQSFRLVNASSNATLIGISAHLETTVDYSDYGATEFTMMQDLSNQNPLASATFNVLLLNVTGIKEVNVYSQMYAPRRVSKKTAAEIIANSNISLASFNPGAMDESLEAADINIGLYISNSSCDVPYPDTSCLIGGSESDMDNFNPLSALIGGGKLSFRMGTGNISVHYINVDMLASGPPDVLFDNAPTNTTSGATLEQARRFGSGGPTIYDYILISAPYTQGSSSATGLNESAQVNLTISTFYDEDWNVIWNSTNGTSATDLAGNYSHYSTYQTNWQVLMNTTICINTTGFIPNTTSPCFIDTINNKFWVRLPHFSGVSPTITGGVITADSPDNDSSPSSGGGGSSGAEKTYSISTTQLSNGYEQTLEKGDRIKFKIKKGDSDILEFHNVQVTSISSTKATLNISSSFSQVKTFLVGDEHKFDVNNDKVYDILVKLVSITSNKANILVQNTTGTVVEEETTTETEDETLDEEESDVSGTDQKGSGTEDKSTGVKSVPWLILIIILIAILTVIGFFIVRRLRAEKTEKKGKK